MKRFEPPKETLHLKAEVDAICAKAGVSARDVKALHISQGCVLVETYRDPQTVVDGGDVTDLNVFYYAYDDGDQEG